MSNNKDVKIGIWGGSGSGKTTFLSALELATLLDPNGNWNIWGNDEVSPGSVDFLLRGSESLRSKEFPDPTTGITRNLYTYEINGKLTTGFAGFLNALRGMIGKPRPVRFTLNVFDYPGGDLLTADPADPLWENLAGCDGLVYLFDPYMDDPSSDNFKCLSRSMSMIQQVIRKNNPASLEQGLLPHYLAMCITKFDDDIVFTKLREAGLIYQDTSTLEEVPYVENTEKAFECFADRYTIPRIRHSFYEDRVRFFVTSSIGFYREEGKVNIDKCCNVSKEPGRLKILGDPIPIGIFEPLLWIQSQLVRAA
jgi:GTPase SAR1 family protein